MNKEKLQEQIQEIIASACRMYVDNPIPKERFAGAAMQILWLLEKYEK